MSTLLTAETVTLPKERTYFLILAIFSGAVWLICAITIFPMIGLAIAGVVLWLVHGLLIAGLKSEAVKVSAEQLPGLSTSLPPSAAILAW